MPPDATCWTLTSIPRRATWEMAPFNKAPQCQKWCDTQYVSGCERRQKWEGNPEHLVLQTPPWAIPKSCNLVRFSHCGTPRVFWEENPTMNWVNQIGWSACLGWLPWLSLYIGKPQPTVGSTILIQVVLNYMRKLAKHKPAFWPTSTVSHHSCCASFGVEFLGQR